MSGKYRVLMCGTTERSALCATSLFESAEFEVTQVVTPPPKPVGRKQVFTPAPLDSWAQEHEIPVLHVQRKLKEVREEIEALHKNKPFDFVVVVDFGYIVPRWLLNLPTIGPINVHPSKLPEFRGSSPAVFALLYGRQISSVCIMRMDAGLDTGPVIASFPFPIFVGDTQTEYYERAFDVVREKLPQTLIAYAKTQEHTEQPENSPTLEAGRLEKADGFIAWDILETAAQAPAINQVTQAQRETFSSTMQAVITATTPNLADWLDRISRALLPWPGTWTVLPEQKGKTEVRAKILLLQWSPEQQLERVFLQPAGESSPKWLEL